MQLKPIAAALAGLSLMGCSVYREATSPVISGVASWRAVVTEEDRNRLRNWRKAWDEALPRARAADPQGIAAQGALFVPDDALRDPAPPPGGYRCRTFKLGAAGTAMREFTAYPWFECRVADEGGVRSLHRLTGAQRPTGLLFADGETRGVFLGTLVLGDETSPLRYGVDSLRDMAGYVERIGEKRWRLVFPYPHFESKLDVIELVPAS
ncbi:MAG: DUF4893 domain-containing protein [Sphingomonas sp.]